MQAFPSPPPLGCAGSWKVGIEGYSYSRSLTTRAASAAVFSAAWLSPRQRRLRWTIPFYRLLCLGGASQDPTYTRTPVQVAEHFWNNDPANGSPTLPSTSF